MSSKGGRKKYKSQKDKRGRDGAPSQEGRLKKRSFQTPGNSLTAESVASLGTTEGNVTGRKKKKLNPTDYDPNRNSPSGEAAQTPAPASSKRGLGREVRAALLKDKA